MPGRGRRCRSGRTPPERDPGHRRRGRAPPRGPPGRRPRGPAGRRAARSRLARRPPEVRPGDDLVVLLAGALRGVVWPDGTMGLDDGDIVVVTSKIISKAEGRVVRADDREDAITAETVRAVASVTREGRTTRIVENRQGLVMAAAGVDASNTA